MAKSVKKLAREKLASDVDGRVRARLSSRATFTEKKMMGKLTFLVDGAICCSVGTEGLLVRVRPGERAAVLAMPHVTPMKLGTRTMQGFVRVAPEAYTTDDALARWLVPLLVPLPLGGYRHHVLGNQGNQRSFMLR